MNEKKKQSKFPADTGKRYFGETKIQTRKLIWKIFLYPLSNKSQIKYHLFYCLAHYLSKGLNNLYKQSIIPETHPKN